MLHVIRTMNPAAGGPVEGIRQLADGYAEGGWDVEVASLDAPGAPWISSFPRPIHALGPGAGGYGFSLAAVGKLRRLARRFDAMIVDGIWEFNGPLALLASVGSRRPFYVFVHGMLDPWFKETYPLKHVRKWLYWPWSIYWLLRRARRVLFTTDEERLLARRSFWLYRCTEAVVGYGTSPPPTDEAAQRAAFEAAYPRTAGKRILLFLGRIDRKKGCDLLIEAFAEVFADKSDWMLMMAGPDRTGWRTDLEARANAAGVGDRILWPGSLQGDVKWGAFRCADAFVLPSHQENFGVAVAEALACSLPVLISNKVNIWREIAREGCGLVSDDTVSGTAGLLRTWSELDADMIAAMRAKARGCFDRNFDVKAAAARLTAILTADADDAS